MRQPRPCNAAEAITRARSLVGRGGQYVLGTGDYRPSREQGRYVDLPWTTRDGLTGSDCAGFAISWCYKLPRHRLGFNAGAWASVSDDLNCNSIDEDADHEQDLGERLVRPELGALLLYPTFRLAGYPRPFIGHVAIVVRISRALEWDVTQPDYSLLDVAQCCGPDERKPAVIATSGRHWNDHDQRWPKAEHRSRLLRVRA